MLYSLKQGPHEQKIIAQCLRERSPLPKTIKEAPELYMGLQIYLDAFFDISPSRLGGMGVMPLGWLPIHQYCQAHGISDEDGQDMHFLLGKMDIAYMDFHRPVKKGKK